MTHVVFDDDHCHLWKTHFPYLWWYHFSLFSAFESLFQSIWWGFSSPILQKVMFTCICRFNFGSFPSKSLPRQFYSSPLMSLLMPSESVSQPLIYLLCSKTGYPVVTVHLYLNVPKLFRCYVLNWNNHLYPHFQPPATNSSSRIS